LRPYSYGDDTNADSDADIDGADAHAYSDSNTYTDPDPNSNTDADSNTYTDPDPDPNSNTDADPNSDTDPNARNWQHRTCNLSFTAGAPASSIGGSTSRAVGSRNSTGFDTNALWRKSGRHRRGGWISCTGWIGGGRGSGRCCGNREGQ
jgi:hypothetical protein